MKRTIFFCLILMMAVACKKSRTVPVVDAHPAMQYLHFADSSIAFGRIAFFDLDTNGEKDVLFSTQLVGDAIGQKDKMQWMVTTSFNANLPVNNAGHIPVLRPGDTIPPTDFSGYIWYNASSIILSQKTIGMTMPPYWEGGWENAVNCFIPIQLKKQNELYNGWIEVSFNTVDEALILHKAAVSKVPGKNIIAGK